MGELRPKRYLMETTGIYHFSVAWRLKKLARGAEVIVMGSSITSRLIRATRKSDPIDAQGLAQLARYEELIRASFVPDPQLTLLRELVRQRDRLIKEVVKFKNRIRKGLELFGFTWKFNFKVNRDVDLVVEFLKSRETFGNFIQNQVNADRLKESWVNKQDFDAWNSFTPPKALKDLVLFEFRGLFARLSELTLLEKRVIAKSKSVPWLREGLNILKTLPGLTLLSQIVLLVEIGVVDRFPTEGHFLSYCGIACRGGTSGVRVRGDREEKVVEKDRPNRRCNPILKRTLVTAGKSILNNARSGNKGDLYDYALKVKGKNIGYFKRVFKVAAKLGRKVYHCLKTGEVYDNFVENGVTPEKEQFLVQKTKRRNANTKTRANKCKKASWEDVYGYLKELGVEAGVLNDIRSLRASSSLLKGEGSS